MKTNVSIDKHKLLYLLDITEHNNYEFRVPLLQIFSMIDIICIAKNDSELFFIP